MVLERHFATRYSMHFEKRKKNTASGLQFETRVHDRIYRQRVEELVRERKKEKKKRKEIEIICISR